MEEVQTRFYFYVIAAFVTFVAMLTDMKNGKIYNWLTFPTILLGWSLNSIFFGFSGFGYSFCATFVGIGLYFIPAALGLVGMGDVKLMGALGAIGGTSFVVSVFLYTSALGIPHALLVQFLNYGKKSFSMLLTSFSTKAFLEKTIQKENKAVESEKRYRFLLGVDIFVASIIALFYVIEIKF